MIATTAYILISTLINNGNISQSTATFADKPSCESAAVRQDFVLKSMRNELSSNPLLLNQPIIPFLSICYLYVG